MSDDIVIPHTSVGPFRSSTKADKALNTTRALADPGYAHAVLENYARTKLKRGRSKFQVGYKLEGLEKRLPHFANDFHSVRAILGLHPSRVLAPLPPPPYSKECSCTCTCGAGNDNPTSTRMFDHRASVISMDTSSAGGHSQLRGEHAPAPPAGPPSLGRAMSPTNVGGGVGGVGGAGAAPAPVPYWLRNRSTSLVGMSASSSTIMLGSYGSGGGGGSAGSYGSQGSGGGSPLSSPGM